MLFSILSATLKASKLFDGNKIINNQTSTTTTTTTTTSTPFLSICHLLNWRTIVAFIRSSHFLLQCNASNSTISTFTACREIYFVSVFFINAKLKQLNEAPMDRIEAMRAGNRTRDLEPGTSIPGPHNHRRCHSFLFAVLACH